MFLPSTSKLFQTSDDLFQNFQILKGYILQKLPTSSSWPFLRKMVFILEIPNKMNPTFPKMISSVEVVPVSRLKRRVEGKISNKFDGNFQKCCVCFFLEW